VLQIQLPGLCTIASFQYSRIHLSKRTGSFDNALFSSSFLINNSDLNEKKKRGLSPYTRKVYKRDLTL